MANIEGIAALSDAVRQVAQLAINWSHVKDPLSVEVQGLEAGIQALQQSYASVKQSLGKDASADVYNSVWQLSCVLWNSAVDVTSRGLCSSSTAVAEQVAYIRHVACSMLLDVPQSSLTDGQKLQLIRFCIKSSEAWSVLDRWEQAELLLASAARLVSATCSAALAGAQQQQGTEMSAAKAEEYCALVYEVHLARYTAACKTNQQDLAREELMLARAAAEDLAPSISSSCLLCYKLARSLHAQVMQDIESATTGMDDAIMPLLQDALKTAYDLVLRAKELGQAVAERESAGVVTVRRKKLLQLEAKVLLGLAYFQLQVSRDPAACLKCTEALRQLETEEGSHPAVSLLAFKAFMALGMLEEAEKEATGIAVANATKQETCLAVIKELLDAPAGNIAQLKPVVQLVLGRFPSDPLIHTRFTEMAVKAASAAAATASSSIDSAECQQQQQRVKGLQDLVLEVLESATELKQALAKEPNYQTQMRDALYQYGLNCFTAKDFDTAVRFFSAMLGVCEDRVKGRVARVLAMCHLGQQQLEKARNFCGLSETYEPGVVATSFIRFKVLLLEGNESAVVEELVHMVQCGDYCNDMLWFAFKEANTANATVAAKAALAQLHDMLLKQDGNSSTAAAATVEGSRLSLDGPTLNGVAAAASTGCAGGSNGIYMPECVVLRVWAKLLLNDLDKNIAAYQAAQQEADAADNNITAADDSVQQEAQRAPAAAAAACQSLAHLSEVLGKVCSRVRKLGLEVFTGEKESAAVQQLEWFGIIAWNAGLHASELSDYQGAAVLMNLSAQLMAQVPSIGPKLLKQQRMAYLLAAAAGLEVHKVAPEHQGSLRLANRMCQAATAVADKLAAQTAGNHLAAADNGQAEAFTLMLQFQVALRLKNMDDMQAITQKLVAHPDVGADKLHLLYRMCTEEPNKYPEMANAALEGSLQKLLLSNQPKYEQLAVVMRMLLQRAGSDAAKLRLYREACGILTTIPPNAYPPSEAGWLVSTCWNRGQHHLKFDRKEEAVAYMQVALDMASSSPQHAAQRPAMTEQLKKTQVSIKHEAAVSQQLLNLSMQAPVS